MKRLQLLSPPGLPNARDLERALILEHPFRVLDEHLIRERRKAPLWWFVSIGVTDLLVWSLDTLQPHAFKVHDLMVKSNARKRAAETKSYIDSGRLVFLGAPIGDALVVDSEPAHRGSLAFTRID